MQKKINSISILNDKKTSQKDDKVVADKDKNQHNIMQVEVKSRIVFLSGNIDKDSAYKVTKSLLLLDELSDDAIKLFINSPGGEINSGFSIFDCIRFLRSPVYVIGTGLVASAAALIYLAVTKENRISFPHARYLLHQPLSGMHGVVTDLEIYSKEIEGLKTLLHNIISKETGQKIATIERDTDRDFWLDAQKAKEYGLVGKVVNNKKEIDALFKKPEQAKKPSEKNTSPKNIKSSKKIDKTHAKKPIKKLKKIK